MASNANTQIWDALAKTDPAHTKPFNRAGGFKGTAIKPIYIQRKLTEMFGACGVGWGMGEPSFQVVPGYNGEILVYCTVSAWHGSPDNKLWGVGGDKIVTYIKANEQYKRPERWENDDEAFKKAFTDAVNNAFKSIGVGADVHMGLFDDDKYVTALKAEFAEPEPAPEVVSAEQRAILIGLIEAANVKIGDVLTQEKIDDLAKLPATRFDGLKRKLNLTIDKNTQAQDAQPRKAA